MRERIGIGKGDVEKPRKHFREEKRSAGRQTLISKQNARLPLKDGESVRGPYCSLEFAS